MITFDNTDIPGLHTTIAAGAWRYNALRRYHFGTDGVSEIRGGVSERPVSFMLWYYNEFTVADDLYSALRTLENDLIGRHETLVETINADGTGLDRSFIDCTLDSIEEMPIPGREHKGAIQDIAGLLDGGWWTVLQFTFTQTQLG